MLHKQLIRRLDLITLQLFVAVHEGHLDPRRIEGSYRGVGGQQTPDGA